MISKAKSKSWQKTCSSLSPKTHPSEVFSLLRSISGSPSPTTSDLPNFPNCHNLQIVPTISPHIYSPISLPKPQNLFEAPRKLRRIISELHTATPCIPLSVHHSPPLNSPQLSLNSQLSTSSGPDQITYPLLSHLLQSALHFLLYIFNLSWSTHTFLST